MGEENDEIFWKMSKWEIENKKKIKICSLIKKKMNFGNAETFLHFIKF